MEVKTGLFAFFFFLHRLSSSIIAFLLMLRRVAHKSRRNLCEEHCFVEYLRVLEVRNSGKK